MSRKKLRKSSAWSAAAAMIATGLVAITAPSAYAGSPIVPGNEGDVGVYTNGAADVMDIGDPTYSNMGDVAAQLAPGVPYTADSMFQSIFEKDKAAGGTDYYLDRVLGVRGTIGSAVLMTRGRSLYMRGANNSNFTTMGFAGTAYAGGPNNLGNFYTVTVPGQTVSENAAATNRFNAPSHAKTKFTIGTTGVTADETKFITYDNVAVTALTFSNPGATDSTFTVRATSPIATNATANPDELTGTRTLTSGANNGLVDTPWYQAKIGLKATGFTKNGTNLERSITVPAGGSLSLTVVGTLYSDTLPKSYDSFQDYAAMSPAAAVRTGITDYNERWAKDIPFIDVPDPAIEKAIVYRWWGERYNTLDANASGYVYQYPTTIEGVNLYQNSIALTQPMHLQDTKWIRSPYLGYGQILNIGELSGSSAFLDSPGHTSWNNHYSQYLGTAGLEAYQVHGGGAAIAKRFAQYFEGDGVGQLEHYDGNGDNLIAYDTNYMPGNDADAITFGFPKAGATAPGSRTIERPESAYVWGDFDAARQLYAMSGASQTKVDAMAAKADAIKGAILDRLWSPSMRMFTARTSHGATSAATANGKDNPLPEDERVHIPARESNLYDVYAQNLIPFEDAGDYVDGFRFLRYGDNFPIFPFYTANQYDRSSYGIGGSNNFSNINFTVQYRGVRSALRHYDPTHKYVTPEYAERLLKWMAWSVYPGGDARIPNQAEYYSNWNATAKTYNRNNPNHVMLGNMNYIYVEDMGGIQPRSDDKIELWPIDLGYDAFMVNNLRYHGHDVTIVWDKDGSAYGLGAGYSLFLDGEKKASADKLGHLTYDPNTNTAVAIDDITVTATGATGASFPTAVGTPIDDQEVTAYLKTAGIDLTEDGANLVADATLSSSYTQQGARPAPWRQFHTPGYSTSSMNYTPGAISATERPVSLGAVNDGQTVNEPYWGNHGTNSANGYVEVDFGEPRKLDNVKVFFVSDRQSGGYNEPARWYVQVPDGSGGWRAVPEQFKAPAIPQAKFNEALFEPVTASKFRVAFTNKANAYTAISEIQAFDSGRDVPEAPNQAPVVTAVRDGSADGNLSTKLVATATDDGVPYDNELSYGWETVSKPAGAAVIFGNAKALSTTVTGTVAGDYTFRFKADDGERSSSAEVTVTLAKKAVVAEFGQSATITTSGTASWENHQNVKAPTTPASSNPGAGNGWGNWGQAKNGTSPATEAWIQYAWDSPVRLSSTDIYWYDDNGGTRRPTATTYAIEYSGDGSTWQPVSLTGSSTYAGGLLTNQYNRFNFAAINAKFLRIRIWGVQGSGAGTGVLRWRANGETVASVRAPVIIRTPTGVVPALPAELDGVYESGAHGKVAFAWETITPAMVAETNVEPFSVYGTNGAYGLIAEAQIYVRPENSTGGISIQGAEEFSQTVQVGEQPYLPERVLVSYNDGSRDNQAIRVNWAYDPSVVNTPGVHNIRGDLVLPDYVSSAGTVATTFVLTVTKVDDTAPTTTAVLAPEAPDGTNDWYKSAPTVTLTAVDDDGGSGVATTEYKLDGGAWTAYATPLTVSAGGSHTLQYRSTDVAGHVETAKSVTFKVDSIAPTAAASRKGRTVTVTATDATSGVESIEVKVDDGQWKAYDKPVSFTGWEAHTVAYRATDKAGGVSEAGSIEVPMTEASIAGTVTSAGGDKLADVCVYLYTARDADSATYASCTQPDGTYFVSVAAGDYFVAVADPAHEYATTWLDQAVSVSAAVSGVDVVMDEVKQARVTGTVTDRTTSAPLANVCVFAYKHGVSTAASYASCTLGNGGYGLYGMEAGSYDVAFFDPSGDHVTQWWDGTANGSGGQGGAAAVALPTGTSSATADAAMSGETTGVVSGKVTNAAGDPVAGMCVYLYTDEAGPAAYGTCTQADGTWYLSGVAPGAGYRAGFADPSGRFVTQWWTGTTGGSPTYAGGVPIQAVTAGKVTGNVNAQVSPVP